MKIYTIEEKLPLSVSEGAKVEKKTLSNGVVIDTVQVGEEGRGRQLGIIPVQLITPWDGEGDRIVKNVKLGTTLKGAPKFFETPAEGDNDEAIVLVVRTPIGHRGKNDHFIYYEEKKYFLLYSDKLYMQDTEKYNLLPMPANVKMLARGIIAQGLAGAMGAGEHFVFQITPPAKFQIKISGRLYGAPDTYNVYVEKSGVSVLTPEEEALL